MRQINRTAAPLHFGVLDYPGAQASAVHGLTDLFSTAGAARAQRGPRLAGGTAVTHWRLNRTSQQIEKSVAAGAEPSGRITALVLPPCLQGFNPLSAPREIVDWILQQHRRGTVITSVCAGAFLLAETGLLEGRRATTHWGLRDQFAARYPGVRLETDKLIVEDGDIITGGGIMTWVDLGLRLIDRFLGPSVMLHVAKAFVVDPRGREQRFYSVFSPQLHHGDEAILAVQHWAQANAERNITVRRMSEVAGLSERTFLRRFQKATQLTPNAYLQALRVGKAREMLEFSGLPFKQISWKLGYTDPGSFRKVFQHVVGLGPAEYRRRFAVR